MMDAETALFGVMGHPVAHSLSPVMHNAAFGFLGLNAVYLAFDVKDPAGVPVAMRTFGIRGMSVTLPHKEALLSLVDELDPMAEKMGAVNTLCLKDDGRIIGLNTDWCGARDALLEAGPLHGKRVAILGAGGAGRAVAFGIREAGAFPLIVNRSREKGEALACDLGADFCLLSNFTGIGMDILVNTTSLGMHPDVDTMPVQAAVLHGGMVVMDIVYNPRKTKLIRAAESLGCRVVDGLEMFIRQGALQFELWTGREAPVDCMRKAVEDVL
ncbi:shikimate dehydrogenase [Desulfobotulus mexicanus]|uniref:Shikimate dehydrogenase (NADP(+)) n=2 Tax=Desulfobotulus mexicanus TaxID=2586642 RepID=A0A5Q4VF66_9BACT|nr:shikimate dehydrogenase [Desulfobotulus mexicanus]